MKLYRPPALPDTITPYGIQYTAPAAFSCQAVKIGDYRGLLFAHVVKDARSGELRILTAWQSRDAFVAKGGDFFDASGLKAAGGAVAWEGVLGDTIQAKKPLWSYFTPARVIAVISVVFLVLSWLKEIRDASGWLLGPEVEPITASEPVNILVGDEPIKFTMGVRNAKPIGECEIQFKELRADPPGFIQVGPLTVKQVPALAPNAPAEERVSVTAVKPGNCEVRLSGEATSGLWPQTRPFSSTFPVHAWSAIAVGKRSLQTSNPKFCEGEYELLVGKRFPSGLEIEAKIEHVPAVQLLKVRFPGTKQWVPAHNWDKPQKEVATLVWQTNEIEAFRSVPFSILFGNEGKKLEANDWESLVRQVQFTFEEAH